MGGTYFDDLTALQLSTQRWFKFRNEGSSPVRRSNHAMASDGTRVFVLGGATSSDARGDICLIHVFDTKDIKFPDPEPNAVNPDVKTTEHTRKSPTGVDDEPRRSPEGDISEGSTEHHAKVAPPPHSSEGEATRLEFERQLSERDQHIARLTRELAALKSEQAEANAAEAARRPGVEREHADDRRLMRTSLMKQIQEYAELVDKQARILSRDQPIRQYEKELRNVRAKLEAKGSELEAVRLRLRT